MTDVNFCDEISCDGTVMPSNITPSSFIPFAADNNTCGEDTTHATTLVVYQQKPFGPMPPKEVLADHTKEKRSLTRAHGCDEILECSAENARLSRIFSVKLVQSLFTSQLTHTDHHAG